jgi:SAM-dependent methyltransferase
VKWLDRVLQDWRIAKARPFIPRGARVLDIGCADGELFKQLAGELGESLGVEPGLSRNSAVGPVRFVAGRFPDDMPPIEAFDVITLLAVLEHFPPSGYANLRQGCLRFLKPGGVLIITVPSPRVDRILPVLRGCRFIDGMSLEEHHGYAVQTTSDIFCPPGFELVKHRRFQLGLNNLFVFTRTHAT